MHLQLPSLDYKFCLVLSWIISLAPRRLRCATNCVLPSSRPGVFNGEPPLPPGFYQGSKGTHVPGASNFQHAFAFDPCLEALCVHPKAWPIICELTDGRPQMNGPGTMIVDDVAQTGTGFHGDGGGPGWHCAAEGNGGREVRSISHYKLYDGFHIKNDGDKTYVSRNGELHTIIDELCTENDGL